MFKLSTPSGYALVFARVTAVLTATGVLAFLFIGSDWRGDNAFLIPDLVVGGLLLAGAAAPQRWAIPGLTVGFAYAAGVLSAAAMTYVVRGEIGVGATLGLLGSIVALIVLIAGSTKTTA